MSRVSNDSGTNHRKPDNIRSSTSVENENEKDFAKLKDSVEEEEEEEHNTTDSVTTFSDREIFDKWCKFWQVTYKDEEEKEYRFGNFQKALKPPKTKDELQPNFPGLADLDEGELNVGSYAYIFKSDIEMMDELVELFPQSEEELDLCITEKDPVAEEDNTDSNPKVENEKDFTKFKDSVGEEYNTDSNPKVENEKDFAPPIKKVNVDKEDLVGEEHNADSVTSLSDREIFDKWCKFWQVTYKDEEEKEYRFGNFQKALKPPKTVKELNNLSAFADHTEEEMKGYHPVILIKKPEIFTQSEELYGCISKSEKDFAKLKDSVGEQGNTDFNPKG